MKHLRALVYRMLLEEPRSGYGLAKQIEERTGWKPSWGAIYPHLESLHEEGEVTVKEEGRKKTYSLTAKGKKKAKEYLEQGYKLLEDMIKKMRVMQEYTGEDMELPIAFLTQLKETGVNPFEPVMKESQRFRKELLTLWQNGKIIKYKKQINEVLKNGANKLAEINKK